MLLGSCIREGGRGLGSSGTSAIMKTTEGGAMSVHTMRLGMGILFLILAGLTFARGWLFPSLAAWGDPVRMNLGGVFALVFGMLNVARWYVAWSYRREQATPIRTPFQPEPTESNGDAPNPDLDFTKMDREKD